MKKLIGGSIIAIAAVMGLHNSAQAADIITKTKEEVVLEKPVSPWQIRVRALGVIPRNSGSVNQVKGSDLDFSKTVTPELDITYYFTKNIAAELVLGTTYSNVNAKGTIKDLGKIGKTWLLPPTLTLQYHFTNFGAFKPYVGAGVNYTIFYNQKDYGDIHDLKIKNRAGGAVQVGFDYMINEHWGFNFDVKKLFLRPNFRATLYGTDDNGFLTKTKLTGKAKLDPWLIGAGITYRF